ncbi:MAG: lactonase family protein [Asticcacaulis sp.]|nr:lactonase family protein [Asticcacaulis sp.]
MTQGLDLFVGAYSSEQGKGLYPLTWWPDEDRLELHDPVAAIENASYGAHDHERGLHYLVNERENGALGVWRCNGGAWQCLATVPTEGNAPCFVTLDPERQHVAVANYASGNIAVYGLDDRGLPAGPPVIHAHTGHGPNAARQDGPHAHCVRYHQGVLYQTDLGTDEVLAFAPDGSRSTAFRAPAGQGPRHIVFHPVHPIAYLVTELGSRAFVLSTADGFSFTERQNLSTLPADAPAGSLGGHLALNRAGDRLYVTNRGHDSVAVFAVGDDGHLDLMQIAPAHGQSPRFLCLLEDHRRVLIAHQNGDSLACLGLNGDGTVADVRQAVAVAKPAYIGFA